MAEKQMSQRDSCSVEYVRPFRRLLYRLFPSRLSPRWEDESGWAPSWMETNTEVHLNWADRLRLLISGRCRVEVATRTSVVVGKAESRSVFCVLPPGRRRK